MSLFCHDDYSDPGTEFSLFQITVNEITLLLKKKRTIYDEITCKVKNGFFLLSSAIGFNDYSFDMIL